MKRYWQVELSQARRRVRVLEYLLERTNRAKPPVIGGGNTITGKVKWMLENHGIQSLEDLTERFRPHGIGRSTIKTALAELSRNAQATTIKQAGHFHLWRAIKSP